MLGEEGERPQRTWDFRCLLFVARIITVPSSIYMQYQCLSITRYLTGDVPLERFKTFTMKSRSRPYLQLLWQKYVDPHDSFVVSENRKSRKLKNFSRIEWYNFSFWFQIINLVTFVVRRLVCVLIHFSTVPRLLPIVRLDFHVDSERRFSLLIHHKSLKIS